MLQNLFSHQPLPTCPEGCDGKPHRDRLALCANRVGKTEGMGGYETAIHLTGRYPHWWDSRQQQMDEPYTDAQIAALSALLEQLRTAFPNLRQIAGHEDLDTALMPASDDASLEIRRKLDPGPRFPWAAIVPACGLQRLR